MAIGSVIERGSALIVRDARAYHPAIIPLGLAIRGCEVARQQR